MEIQLTFKSKSITEEHNHIFLYGEDKNCDYSEIDTTCIDGLCHTDIYCN